MKLIGSKNGRLIKISELEFYGTYYSIILETKDSVIKLETNFEMDDKYIGKNLRFDEYENSKECKFLCWKWTEKETIQRAFIYLNGKLKEILG